MKNESEDDIQAAFFQWLAVHEKRHPELALFYAIPNGSYKSVSARMKFKRTGLKSGVPDVHLPVCNKQVDFEGDWDMSEYNGLWIEFKRTGLKSGVPDVHYPGSSQAHTVDDFFDGLWIEFKSHHGQLSINQKWWIEKLTEQGHKVAVCRSWTEAANITIDYLNLPIEKL